MNYENLSATIPLSVLGRVSIATCGLYFTAFCLLLLFYPFQSHAHVHLIRYFLIDFTQVHILAKGNGKQTERWNN